MSAQRAVNAVIWVYNPGLMCILLPLMLYGEILTFISGLCFPKASTHLLMAVAAGVYEPTEALGGWLIL